MLARLLKDLLREGPKGAAQPAATPGGAGVVGAPDSPIEVIKRRIRAAADAPIDKHMRIAFAGMRVGDRDLVPFVNACLAESNSGMIRYKALHRPLASAFLAQYYLYALGLEGARVECGVFHGASAITLCRAAQTRLPGYAGEGLHLVDSFEGLAEPTEHDRFEGQLARHDESVGKGAYSAPVDVVRKAMAAFPAATLHKGWIPDVFSQLPRGRWAFVHLDVDHYAPTYAGLAYFYPLLVDGGVIICDDYGAPTFPGAHRAWDAYCEENAIPFVVLDTGQSVILKPGGPPV